MYLSNDATGVNDTTPGWHGTYKGQLQAMGVYVYFVSGKNAGGASFNKRGSVTLIR